MNMRRTPIQNKRVKKSTLYSVVFDVVAVRYVAAFVFLFFVFQPIVPAFASEDVPQEVEEENTVASDPETIEDVLETTEDVDVVRSSEDEIHNMQEVELTDPETDSATESETVTSEDVSESIESASVGETDVVPGEETSSADEVTPLEETISVEDSEPESSVSPDTDLQGDSSVFEAGPEEGIEQNDSETVGQLLEATSTESSEEVPLPTGDTEVTTTEMQGLGTESESTTESSLSTVIEIEDTDIETGDVSDADTTSATTTSDATVAGIATTTEEILFEPVAQTQEENLDNEVSEVDSDSTQTDDEQTTPDDVVVATPEVSSLESVQILTNAENRHQFGESECVDVGDGAFYCSKRVDTEAQLEDGVYVQKDVDGDREIFLREDGNVTKVTNNMFEDGAPSYDKKRGEIVFHRLIEGRYQIMRYVVDSGFETQLTNTHENNMEPTQVDGVVVWQRWVVDNWEIVLLQNGDITVITDNSQHDVAPTIRDGYVMWHTTDASGGKLLSVYDIENKISTTIADSDGGHVENPRFVLVYDTTFENGDTVTKEYDPETGEIRPIGSTSTPAPNEIPPPDSTGEVRALINIKTTTKDDTVEEFDDSDTLTKGTSSAPSPIGTEPNASTTDMVTISDLDLATTTSEVLELTDFDIIVEPYSATSTEQGDIMATTSSESEA